MGTTKDALCNSEEETWGLTIEGGELSEEGCARSFQWRDVPVPRLRVHIGSACGGQTGGRHGCNTVSTGESIRGGWRLRPILKSDVLVLPHSKHGGLCASILITNYSPVESCLPRVRGKLTCYPIPSL